MRPWTETGCLIWVVLSAAAHAAEPGGYELAFSTYVGGQNWEGYPSASRRSSRRRVRRCAQLARFRGGRHR
jgi:hypothetical protein